MPTDLEHPTLHYPDPDGTMQVESRDGAMANDSFVAKEDYITLLHAFEELRAPVLEGGGYSHSVQPWSGSDQVCHVVSRDGRVVLHAWLLPLGSELEQEQDAFLQLAVTAANEKE